jgi:hypothetical protein
VDPADRSSNGSALAVKKAQRALTEILILSYVGGRFFQELCTPGSAI